VLLKVLASHIRGAGKGDILTYLSGVIAFILATVFAIASIFLPPEDIRTLARVIVPYWATIFALLVVYILGRIESLHTASRDILSKPYSGLEMFDTSEAFINRLIDISIGGEIIYTLNFSPQKGASRPLDHYFDKLHEYILLPSSSLKSFRSIANIGNAPKARWIFERCSLLIDTGRVSLGAFRSKSSERLLCFHVVFKHGMGYVFFYPPVPLGGVMEGIMLTNLDAAEFVKREFDNIWHDCIIVNDGAVAMKDGLEFLAQQCPELNDDQNYKELLGKSFAR
jgi:hypothetical protein